MPANTPVLALPYPLPADTVDVPRDVQALATKLDGITSLSPPAVSSLPGSPVDGQECYYLADTTNGVAWHLRYRAASGSAYKWEVVGGPALHAERFVEESFSASATTWFGVPNDPIVTVPLAGDYLADCCCYAYLAVAGNMALGVRVGTTDPVIGSTAMQGFEDIANHPVPFAHRRLLTAVAASAQIRQRYWVNTAGSFARGAVSIDVQPVRVG